MTTTFQRHTVPPLSLLFVFLAMVPASAQPILAPKAAPPADQGTALFRGLFHFHGVKPVTEVPLRGNRDTIVVILGPPQRVSGPAAELVRKTLAEGGSMLVATDAGNEPQNLFEGIEPIRMRRGPVVCDSPRDCLGGLSDYPLISGWWPIGGHRHGQLLRLASASPGTLKFDGPPKYLTGFTEGFSGACRRGNQYLDAEELFAAGGTGPESQPYRLLVMADHKVFSNELLYASAREFRGVTPDNFRIANEVVKWLTAEGTRKQCVFIENGKIQPRFDEFDFTALPNTPPKDIPFPPLPNPLERPMQEKLANMIDQGLAQFEDDDRIQQALKRDNRRYGALLGGLAIFGLALAMVLFARRTWRARHSPDYQPLPADPHLLGTDAPLGSFEHRRLELLRGGEFRAPVVTYVRRLFESRGLAPGSAGQTMPLLEINARNRAELKTMIRELWDEAFVFDRDPLPYTRWKEIEPTLATVKAAADGDLWQFRSE